LHFDGVLPVSKELDTSWFDLKNYDKLSELDLFGWQCQLAMRSYMQNYESTAALWRERIKSQPIIAYNDHDDWEWDCYEEHRSHPFNTVSVKSMSAVNAWYGGNDDRLSDIWRCCELDNKFDITEEEQELISKPLDIFYKERGIDIHDYGHFHSVEVSLLATDEQIMSDFHYWLTGYRKAISYESHKKNFTDKDLSEWIEYRVLPYIDLMLIAKLEGKSITQAKAARLIFPDEHDIDITERLRRTTKVKADWLFKDSIIYAIGLQVKASA
jgi:hypothetical protein